MAIKKIISLFLLILPCANSYGQCKETDIFITNEKLMKLDVISLLKSDSNVTSIQIEKKLAKNTNTLQDITFQIKNNHCLKKPASGLITLLNDEIVSIKIILLYPNEAFTECESEYNEFFKILKNKYPRGKEMTIHGWVGDFTEQIGKGYSFQGEQANIDLTYQILYSKGDQSNVTGYRLEIEKSLN